MLFRKNKMHVAAAEQDLKDLEASLRLARSRLTGPFPTEALLSQAGAGHAAEAERHPVSARAVRTLPRATERVLPDDIPLMEPEKAPVSHTFPPVPYVWSRGAREYA